MSQGNWVQRKERERVMRGRNWVHGQGPVRRAYATKRTGLISGSTHDRPVRTTIRTFSQPNSKLFNRNREFNRSWIPSKEGVADHHSGVSTGTKLYISNLDCQIKYPVIDELFSKFGKLTHCKIHYDRTAQPSGSAEVVYARRSDAIKAHRHYNNSVLGGKIMKVHIVDTNPNHFTMRKSYKSWIVGDTIQIPQRTVETPRNFAADGRFLKRHSLRSQLHRGDVQSERMRRIGRIHFQRRRQEVYNMSEDESGTEFENLRVEATYF